MLPSESTLHVPFLSRGAPVTLALAAYVLAACARTGSSPSGTHSTVAVSACQPDDATSRTKPATLVMTFRPEPALAVDEQASVRVLGPDAYRAEMNVSAMGGTRLELPRGTYDVRIALKGYETVVTRAALTGGCSAELVATLRK